MNTYRHVYISTHLGAFLLGEGLVAVRLLPVQPLPHLPFFLYIDIAPVGECRWGHWSIDRVMRCGSAVIVCSSQAGKQLIRVCCLASPFTHLLHPRVLDRSLLLLAQPQGLGRLGGTAAVVDPADEGGRGGGSQCHRGGGWLADPACCC